MAKYISDSMPDINPTIALDMNLKQYVGMILYIDNK